VIVQTFVWISSHAAMIRGFYPYTCWAQLAPSKKQGWGSE